MKFKNKVKVKSKLQFSSDVGFFGPGVCRLLQLIDQTGSIQSACDEMGISYSKARKMLNRLQDQFDCILVVRKAGGSHGGSASLTPEGKQLIQDYLNMNKEVETITDSLFQKYFHEYL